MQYFISKIIYKIKKFSVNKSSFKLKKSRETVFYRKNYE